MYADYSHVSALICDLQYKIVDACICSLHTRAAQIDRLGIDYNQLLQ